MQETHDGLTRRGFLAAVSSVGLAATSTVTTARTRPAEYRWELTPQKDQQRRQELGNYVDTVDPLVTDHPAFGYSTETNRDDHAIDFPALRLYRERNFDYYERFTDPSMDGFVEAIDNDRFQDAKTNLFWRVREGAPREWSREAWRTADSFRESLDYAHSLLMGLDNSTVGNRRRELTALIREAYRRYHPTYDVVAWSFTMDAGVQVDCISGCSATDVGLIYSPQADELRAFVLEHNPDFVEDNSAQWHPLIEEWSVTDRDGGEPNSMDHPALFHTTDWNRQRLSFETAKSLAVEMINHIATNETRQHNERDGTVALTTGLTTKLTRTILDYNQRDDADFGYLWDFANVIELARERGGAYVFDVAPEGDGYDGVFQGNFAVYEVAYDYIPEMVHRDGRRRLDNFGQMYGGLEG